jgi:hypothetical protein
MLDSYIIVGLVMVIVGVLKTLKPFIAGRGKLLIPLLVFFVAGILNVVNAIVFGGQILQALKDGFILGAAAGGIYSMGKSAMDNKVQAVEPLPPVPDITPVSIETKEVEQEINPG